MHMGPSLFTLFYTSMRLYGGGWNRLPWPHKSIHRFKPILPIRLLEDASANERTNGSSSSVAPGGAGRHRQASGAVEDPSGSGWLVDGKAMIPRTTSENGPREWPRMSENVSMSFPKNMLLRTIFQNVPEWVPGQGKLLETNSRIKGHFRGLGSKLCSGTGSQGCLSQTERRKWGKCRTDSSADTPWDCHICL